MGEEAKELEEQVVDTTPVEETKPESAPEKIPESSESSETQNVENKSDDLNDAQDHQKADHETAPHIEDGDEIAKREGFDSEVKLDLSKIEFGEDGLPVLNQSDIDRIKKSGLTISDFMSEISFARDQYYMAKELLDNEDSEEERINKELEEKTKELENATDEKTKEEIQKSIDYLKSEKGDLPKNNPKIKDELEKTKLNSIKLIATYQNISRQNILKLQQNGSLLALVSTSADAVFLSAYTDACLKSDGKKTLAEDDIIVETKKAQEKIYDIYTRYDYLFNNFETIKNKEIVDQINNYINNNYESVEGKKLIDEVITCVNRIPRVDVYPKVVREKAATRLHEISIEAMTFGDDKKVEDLEDVKYEENEKEKFISNIQEYTLACISFGYVYKMLNGAGEINPITRKRNDPDAITSPFPMAFSVKSFVWDEKYQKNVDSIENRYRATYEKYKKEYEEYDDKIYNRETEISDEYKEIIKKDSLVNTFIEYSYYHSEDSLQSDRNKNIFTLSHALRNASALYDMIKIISGSYGTNRGKEDGETAEFRIASESVNTLSMIHINFYNYIKMLRDSEKFDANFASIYDPEDEIKKFYFDNKNYVDEELDEFEESKKEFAEHLIYNPIIVSKLKSFIKSVNDYITEKEKEIDAIVVDPYNKANKKSIKLKDPYEAVNRFSHLNNYLHSYEEMSKYFEPALKEILEWNKNNEGIENDSSRKEELEKRNKEIYEKMLPGTEPIINTIIISTIGVGIIKAFEAYKEHFDSRNENEGLGIDCTKYLFHEFILTYDALKRTPLDENMMTYINSNSKNTSFKGLNYEYQKHAKITDARRIFAHTIFTSMANVLNQIIAGIMNDDAEEKRIEAKKAKKKEERAKKKKKNIPINNENANKKKKEARREKKNIDAFYNVIKNEYNTLINQGTIESNVITFLRSEGRYFIQVTPTKDTRVNIKVLFNKKLDLSKNIQKFLEPNVIDKSKVTSVAKAHTIGMRINEDKMKNLGEKWYYNQYKDNTLIIEDGTSITSKDIESLTISQLCRVILHGTLESGEAKIIEKISDLIIRSGIKFGDKDIVFKSNCKFDIKYFDGSKMTEFIKGIADNGNLNFFNTKTWFIISFELHYDLVNKKEEKKETEVEVKKPETKKEKKTTPAPIHRSAAVEGRRRLGSSVENKDREKNKRDWEKKEDIIYAQRLKRNKNRR